MSPTKPSTASATSQRPKTSPKPSAIPRRVKASNKLRKPIPTVLGVKSKRNVEHASVLNNSTATASTSTRSYFSNASSSDKENIPASGLARPREFVARTSPTRGKTGISKKLTKYSPLKRSALARVPLRELSEVEVFERDEAALGDIRRRRSGEHSGTYIEFDSHAAHPVVNDTRDSSVSSSITENTISSQSTAVTEPDDEKFSVLKRTDSEESLRLKVEAIVAATSTTRSTNTKMSALRQRIVTPMKSKHPAIRNSVSPVHSFTDSFLIDSPEKKTVPPSPSLNSVKSPILAPRSGSPIRKIVESPKRPVRMGLGKKSANMMVKELERAAKPAGEKKKIVITSDKPKVSKTAGNGKTKKAGSSSLRRAAGVARPALQSALTGLENIRRMR